MKTLSLIIAAILIITACKKDSNSSGGGDKITYEASLSSGTFANIVYLDENGQQQNGVPGTNAWQISFINKIGKPRTLQLIVSPYYDLTDPNVEIPDTFVSISVNGNQVKNDTYHAAENVDLKYNLY